jgi:L-Ala-D/L-Glu epimerase
VSGLQLQLRRRERAVEPPQANAHGVWARRVALEVCLGDPSAQGHGEAAPLPDYSPDLLDDCERALSELDPTRLAALDLASPRALLDAAAAALPPELPAARFALETALLDRAGQHSGTPLWRLLSELIPGAASAAPVGLCALLPSAAPARALELARRALAEGVRTFKLKLGPERLSAAQEATLELLRVELGGAVALRLDANRSLSRSKLDETLQRLGRYSVEFLEEPIESPTRAELSSSPCPLALDESLQGMSDGELGRWLEGSSVRVVVLKPTALGGFDACIRLALAARAQGCEAVVSHTLEGPIGWAACAHLALALQGPWAAGLSPLAHQATPLPRILHGQLVPPSEPGLGVGP